MIPAVTARVPSSVDGVVDYLAAGARSTQQVGLENEFALLRADTLLPPDYPQIARLLERLQGAGFWPERTYEGEHLIALTGAGESITLEPGGQIELSSPPRPRLVDLMATVDERRAAMAQAAAEEDLLLVAGSVIPAPPEAQPWMPKGRYVHMREHFGALGEGGRLFRTMMQRTISVQITVDYRDAADAAEILRLGFLSAPVATALFANSPFDGLSESGLQSVRAEAWRFTDPARCGEVTASARPGATLRDYAAWVLDVPLMFRVRADHSFEAMHGVGFRPILEAGRWPDGSPVTLADVDTQLGAVFPDVRLKPGLIELRSTDGQAAGEASSVAAFWMGLLYDDDARRELDALLAPLPEAERAAVRAAVPRDGLRARWGDRPLLEVARETLAIARRGLERRVAAGLECAEALEFLAPIERRAAAGRSAADELLEQWRGPWRQDPAALIEALRVS